MSLQSFLLGGVVGVLAAAARLTPEGRAITDRLVESLNEDIRKATSYSTSTSAPDATSTDAKGEHHAQTA